MIYFSTALWQLKSDTALGVLSTSLVEKMPQSPIALSVLGNMYSLSRDSRTAVAMFTRAVQLDPTLSYAHTLRGYELLSLDQRNEAEQSFREALQHDARHYSALAGLGELHCRVEDDGKARSYFQAALSINQLPTIFNRLASTYHRPDASPTTALPTALALYDRSLALAPRNSIAQHKRAMVLMRLKRYEEAVAGLERLAEECPEEAEVLITLGTCLARMASYYQNNPTRRRRGRKHGGGGGIGISEAGIETDADMNPPVDPAQLTTQAIHFLNRAADLDSRKYAFVRAVLEQIAS